MIIRDIIFHKIRFYNPDKSNLASQLRVKIDQILEIIEISYPPRSLISHDLDIEKNTDDERINDKTKNADPR